METAMSTIERKNYLEKLIKKKNNGLVKVITGVRRCGKSFLLFTLFKQHLAESGIAEDKIISLALDNVINAKYRDPLVLAEYLEQKTEDSGATYYVLLDEIQFVGKKKIGDNPEIYVTFYDVLNSLLQKGNVDIYVTGSNSKMLSSDIATEFRGRGDEIHITPLTYAELYRAFGGDKSDLFTEYLTYGGMPLTYSRESDTEKKKYLSDLFNETYMKDITERHSIAYPEALQMISSELSSAVGSLTTSNKLADTLKTVKGSTIDNETVGAYLSYLTDAYLFSRAERYDVKGRKYFSYPYKYYCVDTGLRNARLNFRQIEETHLMENVIYNELKARGFAVDVGVVDSIEAKNGRKTHVVREIDFVINAETPGERYYIQSALTTEEPEKMEQEIRPFLKLRNDFTKRIVISKTEMKPWTDKYGIVHIGVYDFLLGNCDEIIKP